MARPQSLTLDIQEAVKARYEAGISLADLATTYGLTRPGVAKMLKRLGVALRARGRPETTAVLKPYIEFPNLVVYVADPLKYSTEALMARGLTHAEASKYWINFRNKLAKPMMLLWKDEIAAPCLAKMLEHKTGQDSRLCSARECTVSYVDKATADAFYSSYHLQGKCNGAIHIGLLFEEELVACMTFTHAAACRGTQGDHLLQRFAAAGSVPGAASRLLKAFLKDYPGDVISYSDERYAPGGKLYSVLGFELVRVEDPDYRYWKPDENRWYAKNACQRKYLIARLGRDVLPTDTERTMANELGFKRCYDLGKRTWLLRRNALPASTCEAK